MQVNHPFEPIVTKNSRILVLGSFPSVKSREIQFYYGHRQNRFWKVLAYICDCAVPQTTEEKRTMLCQNQIAVWDVLESCEIEGSADASIRHPVVHDIAGLIADTDIAAVFFNGKAAYQLYQTYGKPLAVPMKALPSTSPANAAFSLEKLCDIWKAELGGFLK